MLAPRRSRGIAIALPLALLIGGCAPATTQPPTASPIASIVAVDVPPTDKEAQVMRLRGEWGLQADLVHVRAVAVDPRSTEYLSILMLPDEIAEMQARASNADAVRDVVQAEANRSPDDFCGSYIDQRNRGAYTSMWKANLDAHAAAIRSKVQPTARLAFRTCRFTIEELSGLCDRLNADDMTWMADIPALATGWSCGSADNFVAMDISSANPTAAATVLRHYTQAFGLPPGILVVRSDGNGAHLKPWGSVLITVLGVDGKPVGPNSLSLNWFSDVDGLQCGGGDVGYGVSWDDIPAELPCQEGTWTIQVVGNPDPDQDFVVYGSAVVTVRGEGTTKVTIRLKRPPPPFPG